MYLTNHKNPEIAFTLMPWYVPLMETREEIGRELYERLKQVPNDTLCGVFYENGIRGMFIAYCREDDVFIWQANAPKNKYIKLVLDTVVLWAKFRGFDWIRLITTKRQAIKRRFGFVNRGIELERSI